MTKYYDLLSMLKTNIDNVYLESDYNYKRFRTLDDVNFNNVIYLQVKYNRRFKKFLKHFHLDSKNMFFIVGNFNYRLVFENYAVGSKMVELVLEKI